MDSQGSSSGSVAPPSPGALIHRTNVSDVHKVTNVQLKVFE
ncbi:hypothetical protein B005_4586 [Nocardiopsis alba ATCC BAA-2165]|uniref:Uncharacterized protein n=1 Tax=Nocardiopsis alba (strain ATCC BAA-2165 / BE74) TaxID=1205910 RepID=J7L5P1_NOCAA|nr:hypothetical protein B005_4586 [Nocardiopsis alba ATCC BAA-2165]